MDPGDYPAEDPAEPGSLQLGCGFHSAGVLLICIVLVADREEGPIRIWIYRLGLS